MPQGTDLNALLAALGAGATLPDLAPTPAQGLPLQPQDTLQALLQPTQPEPLSTKERVIGGIGDALSTFAAIRQGRAAPPSSIQQLQARKQAEAQRQTQARRTQAGIEERRRAVEEAQEFQTTGQAEERKFRVELEGLRAKNQLDLYTTQRGDADKQRRLSLLESAADIGALGDVDQDTLSENDIRALISKRRFALSEQQFGKAAALKEKERLDEVSLMGDGLFADYILGNPQLQIPSIQERVSAGQPPEQVIREFELRLRSLGVPRDKIVDLRHELMVEFSDEFSRQNPVRPERGRPAPGGPVFPEPTLPARTPGAGVEQLFPGLKF